MRLLGIGIALAAIAAAAGLDAESAKQALNAKWQKLRPESAAERNVLFQNVKLVSGGGTSYIFHVTALIRDYEAGYPKNRYYGQTCVGNIDGDYTIHSQGGAWEVDGVMTPPTRKCQPNPSAGVSSIPVSSLQGTQAASGPMAAAPAQEKSTGGVAVGPYQCWAFNQGRGMMNFTILAGGKYKDSNGAQGTFAVGAGGAIQFHGGLLDGGIPAGMHAVYYEPQGRPTVSIRGADNGEAMFCQR